ncbi:DUF2997 domain-containing protein [filamentous cyanobacterium LEGE 11480]|uniref:DUF2997 domain-containing protein n=1 Tax=Romeriopsis navalis LEGE 11480 TaxID=2777977 RepID=A0A928VTT8_9CYAN|nr:DUF2997 domain-containing protein [Romeriopsis navalis]MBE9032422.1 DUF2997 domain-containing protein [Romeriopsis navalis LEGE 11480]
MAAQIKVTFLPDGSMQVDVQGVQGQSCQALTQPLDQLGPTQTELKPEFYDTAAVAVSAQVNIAG